jgi:hypothetical protein
MVLLVLKLFVSICPLKLKGVLCIYVLLFHEGQAENHFAVFFYMVETQTWLSMHHDSWSFVCVSFHVITWLVGFIVKIISFMPMFRVLWSQHSMLYIVWLRLCWCMSPQKLLFCYHLPTRGWAGVKLGDAWYVSNVSIFFMFHAYLCTICFVFCYTSWRFYAFSGTNLLTRCHSASSLFSTIFVFQKSYTGNILGIGRNKSQSSYFSRRERESKAETEGDQKLFPAPSRRGESPPEAFFITMPASRVMRE